MVRCRLAFPYACTVVIAIAGSLHGAVAQSSGGNSVAAAVTVPPVTIPAGVGPLPDLSKGGGAGVAVSQPYVAKYAAVLPVEVADLLSRGGLAFEAALRTKNVVALSDSQKGVAKGVDLVSGSFLPESLSPKGSNFEGELPFPSPSTELVARDPASAGYHVLWNAAAVLWRLGYIEFEGRARIFQDSRSGPRELQFTVARIYPRNFGATPGKLISLFREKIALTVPTVLKGVTWLTLRFLTAEEDYLWASSPTTMSTRQMTGSNRGDLIFPRGFSPDDLFVWSGKVEGTAVKAITKTQMLVPIAATSFSVQEAEEGCASVKGSSLEISLEARRVPQAPSWLPSNAFWELREVWKLEVENRDPFSLDTRGTLFIDAATYSPVYRVVYGDKGEVRRINIGVLGAVQGAKAPPLFWRGAIVINPAEEGATVIEPLAYKVCSTLSASRELKNFDPKSLIAKPTKGEIAGKMKSNPQSAASTQQVPPTPQPVDEDSIPQD